MAIQEDPSLHSAVPHAEPAPAAAALGSFCEGGRSLAGSAGWSWIVTGFGMFRPQAGIWILLALVAIALLVFLYFIPVLGMVLATLLVPVLVGGFMAGCQAIETGAQIELAHLFAGFRAHTGQLVALGVVAGALTLGAMIPVVVIMGVGTFAAMMGGEFAGAAMFGMSAALAALLALALSVPITMALWFAPALVMLRGETAVRAIVQSFRGCLRNIVPFLLYGVIVLLLAVAATIPAGLGWLVLGPVLTASIYAGYRDIFFLR